MRIDTTHSTDAKTSGTRDTNEKRPVPLREKREDGETEGSCWTVIGLPPRRAAIDDRLPAARRVPRPAIPPRGCPPNRPARRGASVSPFRCTVPACAARDASCGVLRRPAGLSAVLPTPIAAFAESPVFRLTRRPAASFLPRSSVFLVFPVAICRFPGISMRYGGEPCVAQAGRRIGFSSYIVIPSVSHWYPNSCRYACLSCSNWAALSENAW